MPIQIEKEKDGVVVIRAVGKLVQEDYPGFTAVFEEIVRQRGKLRILFDMADFDGWDSKGIWEEAKFDLRHDDQVSRLAMVGDEKWHRALAAAAKPFAAAEIRYFSQGDQDEARRWLVSSGTEA